ncbi:hypothetical protein U9M48_039977 [Paspalum notatum var. saurae]
MIQQDSRLFTNQVVSQPEEQVAFDMFLASQGLLGNLSHDLVSFLLPGWISLRLAGYKVDISMNMIPGEIKGGYWHYENDARFEVLWEPMSYAFEKSFSFRKHKGIYCASGFAPSRGNSSLWPYADKELCMLLLQHKSRGCHHDELMLPWDQGVFLKQISEACMARCCSRVLSGLLKQSLLEVLAA